MESTQEFETKQQYWEAELKASMKMVEKWHKKADAIDNRYRGKKPGDGDSSGRTSEMDDCFRLNLFNSNITTTEAMMFGSEPKIDVSRRYQDPGDDVGRVAALIMERLLNLDLADNGAEIECTLQSALQDRLLSGLGCGRVRYTVEMQDTIVPDAIDEDGNPVTQQVVVDEDAPIDYYHWGDVLWSWSRNFAGLRWLAFRNYMTRDEVEERFGPDVAKLIKLQTQHSGVSDDGDKDESLANAWKQAEVWEIWDKASRKVCWVSLGMSDVLETKDDPLQLGGFFPSPPFLMANATTSLYMPTPDFVLVQDVYNEIDLLQTRISTLTEAVKLVGLYDSAAADLQTMFQNGMDNQLIPVDNWALFSEKGGIKGAVDWVPLDMVVQAIDILKNIRNDYIGLLQQITGMSDIMRGQLDKQYEGVGQSEMKAKFGSVRVQMMQEKFAGFATNLMQLKAEVICKHFSPETIARRANLEHIQPADRELVPQALERVKDYRRARLTVNIRPESVAMVDFAQLKSERTEYINALATFMQSAAPLLKQKPESEPFLLALLQWGLAGFKGSKEIEGVIDKAIEAALSQQQQGGEQKPDPEMLKLQLQKQIEQAKQGHEMQKIQAKAQADLALRQMDMQADIQTAAHEHETKINEIRANMHAKITELQNKLQADVTKEQAQAYYNSQQTATAAQQEVAKDAQAALIEMEGDLVKSEQDMIKAAHESKLRVNEAAAKASAAVAASTNGSGSKSSKEQ